MQLLRRKQQKLSLAAAASARDDESQLQLPEGKLDFILDVIACSALNKTAATGAAIALLKGDSLVCCARAGEIAPDLGVKLSADSGFTGACVRDARPLYAADSQQDPRADRRICATLGIACILAVPVLRNGAVIGVIELLASETNAFNAAQVHWLEEVAHLISQLSTRNASASVPNGDLPQQNGPHPDKNEDELASLVQLLQKSAPNATWDDIKGRITKSS